MGGFARRGMLGLGRALVRRLIAVREALTRPFGRDRVPSLGRVRLPGKRTGTRTGKRTGTRTAEANGEPTKTCRVSLEAGRRSLGRPARHAPQSSGEFSPKRVEALHRRAKPAAYRRQKRAFHKAVRGALGAPRTVDFQTPVRARRSAGRASAPQRAGPPAALPPRLRDYFLPPLSASIREPPTFSAGRPSSFTSWASGGRTAFPSVITLPDASWNFL